MPRYAPPTEEGFAKRLARLRKAAGFTQEQLAAELHVSSLPSRTGATLPEGSRYSFPLTV